MISKRGRNEINGLWPSWGGVISTSKAKLLLIVILVMFNLMMISILSWHAVQGLNIL